jgi:hypothetical protein
MNATNFIIIVFLPPLAKNAAKKKLSLSLCSSSKRKRGKVEKRVRETKAYGAGSLGRD